jgi:hypothetical protein
LRDIGSIDMIGWEVTRQAGEKVDIRFGHGFVNLVALPTAIGSFIMQDPVYVSPRPVRACSEPSGMFAFLQDFTAMVEPVESRC